MRLDSAPHTEDPRPLRRVSSTPSHRIPSHSLHLFLPTMPVPLAPQQTNVQSDSPTTTRKQPQAPSAHIVSSKKEAPPIPPPLPQSKPLSKMASHPPSQTKKIPRRSSKPILNWFQRKLAGTVRARSDAEGLRGQRLPTRSPSLKEKQRRSSVPMPTLSVPTRIKSHPESKKKESKGAASFGSSLPRDPISLNDQDDVGSNTDGFTLSEDGRQSSLARDSMWSPTSHYEADEDASLRPLPPSSPPSPSPSLSSSSYLSNPHTFRSMTAPPTPTTPGHRLPPHIRTHSTGPGSGGSITFSAIAPAPASPISASRPSSGNSMNAPYRPSGTHPTLQAPQHTAHHPRNNPRPSSPPQDDASVLTLASSAFGMPGARTGVSPLALSRHHSLADDSISRYSHAAGHGDSTSHFLLGEMDDDRLERYHDNDQDVDASVRALRPRSSRRGSWESEASGWSASASLALTGTGTGAPSALGTHRERSLWTTGSFRTGGVSEYTNAEESELAEGASDDDGGAPTSEEPSVVDDTPKESLESIVSDETEEVQTPPAMTPESSGSRLADDSATPSKHLLETPKGTAVPLAEVGPMPASMLVPTSRQISTLDSTSIATTDIQTDAWRTAASTPIPA
ncbi:hypothetical protein B0H21DRAFT_189549 [Amylocystis lapponica]|nr:hypothetical protein B0H21DRAFT_189549 [Amylocystis lapponica]